MALTPGEAFDAPGFLRISYATSMKELERGSQRILEFLATRTGVRCRFQPEFLDAPRVDRRRGARAHRRRRRSTSYGTDALKRGQPADVVVAADGAEQVVGHRAALCGAHRVPLVPRGGGTGYTGGAVPVRGGVVLSLERMNRILEIDEENLVAVVEPNVITGDLQDAVEKVGLFYPPDPASLRTSVIGGNVAECAGGPRAFKYGTTKQYVLGLAGRPAQRRHRRDRRQGR